MFRQQANWFILIAFLMVTGCAGSGDQPILPSTPDMQAPDRVEVVSPNRELLGYWQCAYDSESEEIIAIPARTALYHINAVKPINNTLGLSVAIDHGASNPAQGLFKMTISLTHPFAGNDSLAGFDVRGVFITTGSQTLGGINFPYESDAYLIEPDGYTRWWNPVEFPVPGFLGYTPGDFGTDLPSNPPPSMINPYMQFADALLKNTPISVLMLVPPTDPSGRGVFTAGSTNSRDYEVKFPLVGGVPQIIYNYAVDASWVAPLADPPVIPTDFPSEANAPEAFLVDAEVTDNTLWAIEGSGQGGGVLDLSIEIWDWQGWMDDYAGQIGEMVLLSPFCEFGAGVIPSVEVDGGKATLTAIVPGTPTVEGLIPVYVGVAAAGTSYKQGAKPAPDVPVAAFDLIEVNVTEPDCVDNGNTDCYTSEPIDPVDSVSGILCLEPDSSDWFGFTVPPAGTASGEISLGTYGIGNLSLLLYKDCPGELIDYSTTPGTADELLEIQGLGPGTYYIKAVAVYDSDFSPRPYLLETDLEGFGSDCTTDANNQSEDATVIALDGYSTDSVCLVGDPIDWYTFEISSGAAAYGSIDLSNNAFANNDIAVFGEPIGDPLFIGNNIGVADEHLDIDALAEGTYYIRIDAKGSTPAGDRPFTLTLDLTEIVSECDDEDGNNTPAEAETIGLIDTASGTVCFPSDPDWYTFDVPSQSVEGYILLETYGLSDCNLALYEDPTEPPIEESANPGFTDEQIDITELLEGVYFIKVTAAQSPGGINQAYGLATQLQEPTVNPTDIWLHIHIVRTSEGTSPATDPVTVANHVAAANQFYSDWVDGSVTLDELTYIDSTAWLSLTIFEGMTMFEQYGTSDGTVNVFYVNDFPGMPGAAAYAFMDCQFAFQDHTTAMIFMSDYADDPVLPHELGHAVGLLADLYLLGFLTCDDITYCPTGPSDIYCDEPDGVAGNLWYLPVGSDINDYFMSITDLYMSTPEIDSQGENMMYFQTNYPDAFFEP